MTSASGVAALASVDAMLAADPSLGEGEAPAEPTAGTRRRLSRSFALPMRPRA